jgi:transcriptional regulator with XRE-family HTH domain
LPPPIGASVKAARERLGWSREALAYHSGVSWAAIAQIETGRRTDVRLSSLSALARALGLSIDQLVGHPARRAAPTLEHQALVYRSDTELLSAVIPFLNVAVERSEPALLVAPPANLELVRRALGGDANQVEYTDSSRWYTSPVEALHRYRSYLDERIAAGSTWVRIAGEPVWDGRSSAEIREWTRYEAIINLSFATAPATILCTYDARSLPASVLADACCTHPDLAHSAGAEASPSYRNPEEFLLAH